MNAKPAGPAELLPHDFERFRQLIRRLAGIDLRDTKRDLVAGRVQRRLRELGLSSFSEYLRLLEEDATEHEEFINSITTNKTSFFRESHHFDFLRETVLPEIALRARAGGPRRIRIWSAGCSTGQEPWTIAMVLADTLGLLAGWDVRILASDLDTSVLGAAARATYTGLELEDVPEKERARHFVAAPGGYRVRDSLRALVTFRRINLVAPEAWTIRTNFDVIFCRNVAIYFDQPTQALVFGELASRLEPTGYLITGHSENLHGLTHLVRPIGQTVHVPAASPRAALGRRRARHEAA